VDFIAKTESSFNFGKRIVKDIKNIKMKLTALFVLTAFITFGQTLKDAIRKTDNEL
jgi:hypothetical protein